MNKIENCKNDFAEKDNSRTFENFDILIEEIRAAVKKSVSESRYEHSLRTAKMCKELCKIYGVDENKGYLAGLAHDLCKKMSDEELFKLAKKDGKDISELEKNKPSLLHGRAASIKIQRDFKIFDAEIIEAIANHTFGGPGLCDLAKLLYVADKIEPGREQVTPEYLAHLTKLPLNKMVFEVVTESVQYLQKKGKKISFVTQKFLEELEKSF